LHLLSIPHATSASERGSQHPRLDSLFPAGNTTLRPTCFTSRTQPQKTRRALDHSPARRPISKCWPLATVGITPPYQDCQAEKTISSVGNEARCKFFRRLYRLPLFECLRRAGQVRGLDR